MSIKQRARAMLSVAIAGMGALLLIFGGATSVTAAPNTNPLIDPDRTGQVTIHPLEQDVNVGEPMDGHRHAHLDERPGLPGLTFTATKISSVTVGSETYSLDLTTNVGWENASRLDFSDHDRTWTFDNQPAEPVLDTSVTYTANTGPAGGQYSTAVMTDMAIGLYLFEESDAPAAVTKSLPWMMTVPLTDPVEPTTWMYDIHAYPKNTTTAITKTVDDSGARVPGDIVEWTITAGIPLVANSNDRGPAVLSLNHEEWTGKFYPPAAYVIEDDFDPRLVPVDTNNVEVKIIGADTPILSHDYRFEWSETNGRHAMKFSVNEQGLTKLATAVSSSATPENVKLQLTVKTAVRTLSDGTIGDGLIDNQARLYLDPDGDPILSNEPISKWGDILIEKVDDSVTEWKLAGAQFSVYATQADAKAGKNPLDVNGKTTFETDSRGIARISGLRYSGWSNNETVKRGDPGWTSYWIVETRAPVGYELRAEPIEVVVDSAQQSVDYATVVKNVPHNARFELPLTGAGGTWLFTAAGVLLAGGGAALLIRKKKPAEPEEN